MSDISARVREIRAIENLSAGRTVIHRLHPAAKLLSALIFIVFVASFGRYDFLRLVPYLLYPFLIMALAELPYKLLLSRVLIALPFCLLAGLSNVIFDRAPVITFGGVTVSLGVISLATILLKMYLCVMSALALAATTPFSQLTVQMRRLLIPMGFVIVFEMTFRYIAVLIEEAYCMLTAYKLRSGTKKALEMSHIGPFIGQMLLRGFDRAERVHSAMRCRGYSLKHLPPPRKKIEAIDIIAIAAVCIPSILLRFIRLY